MKHLIYTTAQGDPIYLAMARELVRSARRHGFEGEILVLTDREENVEGARCHVDAAAPDRLIKAGLIRALSPGEIAAYDAILYVDSDCLFRKAPEDLFRHDGLRLFAEKGIARESYNFLFFDEEENERAVKEGLPRINSGTIRIPGLQASSLLSAWQETWLRAPREALCAREGRRRYNPLLMDQPALQVLLLRAGLDWSPFPPGTIGFPVYAASPAATLLHFCGPLNGGRTSALENKRQVLRWMREQNQGSE
jgi:hypothetical protein